MHGKKGTEKTAAKEKQGKKKPTLRTIAISVVMVLLGRLVFGQLGALMGKQAAERHNKREVEKTKVYPFSFFNTGVKLNLPCDLSNKQSEETTKDYGQGLVSVSKTIDCSPLTNANNISVELGLVELYHNNVPADNIFEVSHLDDVLEETAKAIRGRIVSSEELSGTAKLELGKKYDCQIAEQSGRCVLGDLLIDSKVDTSVLIAIFQVKPSSICNLQLTGNKTKIRTVFNNL